MPKNCCQNRLTATRAVSGFSGATSQLRQIEPRQPLVRIASLNRRQHRRHARLDLLARLVVLPADHHERIARLLQIAEDERARRRFLGDDPRRPRRFPRRSGLPQSRRSPAGRPPPDRNVRSFAASSSLSFLSGPPLTIAFSSAGNSGGAVVPIAFRQAASDSSGSVAGSASPTIAIESQ